MLQAGNSSSSSSSATSYSLSSQLPDTDHDRKRRYLSLLPPPQIIALCLTFDVYVPAAAKTLLWPKDIEAAIAALEKSSNEQSASSSSSLPADSNPRPHNPPKPPNISAAEAPGPPGPSGYQPQRFVYANQPAYPHTPYYSQPPWATYPQPPPSYPALPHHHPPYFEGLSTDDLPSYEDMIVEALNDDVRDPEGLAPKDLYTWMASHYPVQANFRPSASQALQKAYKRGRFEKSLSGKYRLNPSWKGGNTTRRTTRRPQTHAASATPIPTRYVNKTSSSFSQPNMLGNPSTTAPQLHDSTGDLSDAYEAAQHILRTLNFSGELLRMPEEGTSEAGPSGTGLDADMTVESVRAQLQAQLALLAAQLSEIASEPDTAPSSIPVQSAIPDNNATAPVSSLDAVAAILAGMLAPGGSASSTTTATPASAISPTPQVAPPPVLPPVATHPMELTSVKQEEQVIHLHSPAPPPPPSQEMAIAINNGDDSDDEEMDEIVV